MERICAETNWRKKAERLNTVPKGKYYEYQIKRAALDDNYLMGNIDELQYARESLDLDLKYEKYIQRKKWKE